jgi:hypothetical protein
VRLTQAVGDIMFGESGRLFQSLIASVLGDVSTTGGGRWMRHPRVSGCMGVAVPVPWRASVAVHFSQAAIESQNLEMFWELAAPSQLGDIPEGGAEIGTFCSLRDRVREV